MQFKAEVPVSAQDISYAFIGTIESGYDWFHQFDALNYPPAILQWYADPAFFERDDFEIEVIYDDPNSENGEGNAEGTKTITPEDVQKGLTLMAQKAPDDLANLVSESSADANTYDVFMQYVVFGEVIYG